MKSRKVTLPSGKEIETLDVIHNHTTTFLSFKDRVRVLFGKPIHTHTEIYTGHEDALLLGSKTTSTYVEVLFPRKQKGGLHTVTPENKENG